MALFLLAQEPHRVGVNRHGVPTWQLVVHIGTHRQTSKRIQKMKRFAGTEREARRAAGAFAAELTPQIDFLLGPEVVAEDRPHRIDRDITFGRLVDRYYLPEMFNAWKPSVRLQRQRDVDAKLRTRQFWGMGVRTIRPVDVNDLFKDLRDHGSATGGPLADIKPITQIVSGALNFARNEGVRDDDPSDRVPRNGARKPRKRNTIGISPEEFVRGWTAAKELDPRVGIILGCEICSGVRRSELVGLRWPDFDAVAQQFRVHAPITYGLNDEGVQGLCVNDSTKTHADERIVKLGWDAVRMMLDHRRWCDEEAAKHHTERRPDGYIFSPQPDGSVPFWPTSIDRLVREVCDKAGLPRTLELQGLRGLVSSLLIANGVDQAAYMAQQGHSITTALRFYAYASEKQKAEAAEGLCATIAGYVGAEGTDATEVERKLLEDAAGMLAKLDPAVAEQARRALRSAMAEEASRQRAMEAAIERAKLSHLSTRRDATPQIMALEVARALRSAGFFQVTAKNDEEAEAWRKTARWFGRMVLKQPLRSLKVGTTVTVTLLVQLAVEDDEANAEGADGLVATAW